MIDENENPETTSFAPAPAENSSQSMPAAPRFEKRLGWLPLGSGSQQAAL